MAKIVRELVQQAIDSGLSSEEILNCGLLAGKDIVGRNSRPKRFMFRMF